MGTDITTFKRTLGTMIERGDLTLPSTVNSDSFRNAAIVAFQTNPQIRRGTPESVFTSLRHIAGAGLMPDGREAAIVIYGDKAQANIMIGGLRKIVRNSGQVKALWDDVVYEGEQIIFKIEDGMRTWDHINEDGTPLNALKRGGNIIGAYAAAKMSDGTGDVEVMTLGEIEKRRRASPNQKGDKPTGIWRDWFPEMARKTAARALCKRLPMASEDYNRIMADPAFQDVPQIRDVTPAETTEERLARMAKERSEPDEADEAGPPIDGEVVTELEYDETLAAPMDKEFGEGVAAFDKGQGVEACPYSENPQYSTWVYGLLQAEKNAASVQREKSDG